MNHHIANKRNLLYVSIAALVMGFLWRFPGNSIFGDLAGLAWLTAFIMGLVMSIQSREYIWTVLILFFTPIATLFYSIL